MLILLEVFSETDVSQEVPRTITINRQSAHDSKVDSRGLYISSSARWHWLCTQDILEKTANEPTGQFPYRIQRKMYRDLSYSIAK
jgi:hypothetical protein